MDGDVFVNYHGADSRSYAALLYVALSHRFGPERVFLDSESIPAGADFAAELISRIHRAGAVLAVIGPDWLTSVGTRWRPWQSDAAEWTRRELVEALAAGVRVIPILTDGTELPSERQLPRCLGPLGRCQYRRLRHRDATADLERISYDLMAASPELARAATGRVRHLSREG